MLAIRASTGGLGWPVLNGGNGQAKGLAVPRGRRVIRGRAVGAGKARGNGKQGHTRSGCAGG